jgi:hypothetical protein
MDPYFLKSADAKQKKSRRRGTQSGHLPLFIDKFFIFYFHSEFEL